MKKKIKIISAVIENDTLLLLVDEKISFTNVIPREQMLVDSDQFEFIYILEVDGEYTYVVIHEPIWTIIKEALDQSLSPVLFNQKEQLFLPMFYVELEYLIENIRGNSNYGDKMVEKVEHTF